MASIGKVAEQIINRSPFLREAMTEDLINISALARKIKPELDLHFGKSINEGAIIMAIKRLSPGTYHRLNLKIKGIVSGLNNIKVTKNIHSLTFKNSSLSVEKLNELFPLLETEEANKPFYSINKGINELTIISNEEKSAAIINLFGKETLITRTEDIAVITVQLPQVNLEIYGVYYYILKQLAWEGINIVDIISTANEFSLLLSNEDLMHSIEIIERLSLMH